MTPKEYQLVVENKLLLIFNIVNKEWTSIKGNSSLYCPRVDIAVGPFATEDRHELNYDILMDEKRDLIENLIQKHNDNLRKFGLREEVNFFDKLKYFNQNARCLLCIEIENKVSRKHLIGGFVNASALGRIGILIPWTSDKLKASIKLKNYLLFLNRVGKNTFKTDNILIVTKEQLNECLGC